MWRLALCQFGLAKCATEAPIDFSDAILMLHADTDNVENDRRRLRRCGSSAADELDRERRDPDHSKHAKDAYPTHQVLR